MSLLLTDDPAQQRSASQEASLRTKLEAVRTQLRLIGRDIQAVEGRFFDYDMAETITRTLHHTGRQLDAIALQVAVLERRAAHNG